MAHLHGVIDADKHFVIDAATREITNQSEKITLMQNDHNSERFTFEIPREIDGHDMSLCNVVRVHYLNIDTTTKAQNPGFYEVKDLQISPDDETKIIGSWLISANATKNVGNLNFTIRFKCVADDGTIEYAWSSAIFKGISVGQSYNNTGTVAEEYADIFAQWQARIEALEQGNSGSGLTEEQAAEIAANTEARHTHDNKAVLDILTPDVMAEFDDTVLKRHEHKNKNVLDSFTTSMIDAASVDYNGNMLALYSHVTSAASNLRKTIDEKIAEISDSVNGKDTVFIELKLSGDLVNSSYEEIDTFITNQQAVVLFRKLSEKQIDYYSYAGSYSMTQSSYHIFTCNNGNSQTKILVYNDGTIRRTNYDFVTERQTAKLEIFADDTDIALWSDTFGQFGRFFLVDFASRINAGTEIASIEIAFPDENNGEYINIKDMYSFDTSPYIILSNKVFYNPDYETLTYTYLLAFTTVFNTLITKAIDYGWSKIRITYYTD